MLQPGRLLHLKLVPRFLRHHSPHVTITSPCSWPVTDELHTVYI